MIPQTISNNEEHGCDDNDCWWWRRWEMWQLEKVKLRGKNWNSCFYIQVRQETAVSEEVEDSRPASSSSKDSSSLPSARSTSSFFPSLDIPSQTTPPVFSSPPSHPSRPSTATRHYKIHPSSGESAFGKFVIFIFFLPPKIPHPGLHQDQSHPVHHQSLKGLDRAGAPNYVLQCGVGIPFNTDSKKHIACLLFKNGATAQYVFIIKMSRSLSRASTLTQLLTTQVATIHILVVVAWLLKILFCLCRSWSGNVLIFFKLKFD